MRLLGALLVLALAATASATPREIFDAANKAFRAGQYEEALKGYNSLVHPHVELADSNDLVEAYINLGVCRVEVGDDATAKEEFEKALELDPNTQLDRKVITNQRAIKLFDDTKADMRDRARKDEEKRREAERIEALKKIVGVRENPYYMNWLPFGVGQFQNGDTSLGIVFLSTEVATLATSAAIWGYLVNKYGIRNDHVPFTEGPTMRRLTQLEVGTGVAFWSLYALGVMHAHLHYKRQTRTKLDDELLKQLFPGLGDEDKKTDKKPPKTSFRDRLYVTPMATQDGVGIGLGWEN